MKWVSTTIGQHCTVTSSKRFHLSERSNSGIPFYCSKEIIQKVNGEEVTECDYIKDEAYERVKKTFGVPQAGDLLITTRGTYGIPYIYQDRDKFYFADGNLTWLKDFDDSLLSPFLYYWIRSHEGQKKIDAIAKGTAQKAVPISLIKDISLSIPPVQYQQKVVDILSAYDNLIENNQNQIKLLEEAAQRLYKEWFVDLRFPGHETTPIVDGVPDGWRMSRLSKISPIVTGKKDANYGTADGQYPFFTCAQIPIKAPHFSFDCDAVILAGNGDFNVKLYRGKFEAYQRTYVFSPNDSINLFLLYYAVCERMKQLFQGASGSTIKFLTKRMLEDIPVLIPDNAILQKYNSICESYQSQIEILTLTYGNAQEARDRLLPKLMNGEIEV